MDGASAPRVFYDPRGDGDAQADILGGGYYDPLFPLIPPADRVGQIELLTTVLRRYFGKRPRGAWLNASAWEPGLISSFCTCGIEYVLLDKLMLETSGYPGVDGNAPVTIEDNGKTITAGEVVAPERLSPKSFFDEIRGSSGTGGERQIVIFIGQDSIAPVFSQENGEPSWIESLLALVRAPDSGIEPSTTGRVLKARACWRRAYISAGMSPYEFNDLAIPDDIRILARTTAKHFLAKSANSMNLYAKMMYVHTLVNQLRGDKSRKKNAREELWLAQNNEAFRSGMTDDSAHMRTVRQITYRNLINAEKSTRLRGVFSPSINTFDFDMDGLKEYLSQLERYNMYVHLRGGRVFEFDVFDAARNFCDMEIPGTVAGLFIDHFITSEDLPALRSGTFRESRPVFANSLYQDLSVDPFRQEINLKANGLFGAFQQPLSLRKQYSFRNEGIQVQYILKNESPLNLSGIFMIELDLLVSEHRGRKPGLAVYARDFRKEGPLQTIHEEDVSWIQIDDAETGVKFTLDANENPSITVLPVDGEGLRAFLWWKAELSPNYEMEKMVFFKIDT